MKRVIATVSVVSGAVLIIASAWWFAPALALGVLGVFLLVGGAVADYGE